MEVTIERLKHAIKLKGYKWFEDKPNFIGVRTTLDIPNRFNDVCYAAFMHKGKWKLRSWVITTDPGLDYQKRPLNKKGCAGLVPGQYIDCFSIGYHKWRMDHPCLRQVEPVQVYRDDDGDGYLDRNAKKEWGMFGINLHRAARWVISKLIGKYSAGCQVWPSYKDHSQFMWIAKKFKKHCNNKFTYTLLEEVDL